MPLAFFSAGFPLLLHLLNFFYKTAIETVAVYCQEVVISESRGSTLRKHAYTLPVMNTPSLLLSISLPDLKSRHPAA